MIIAQDTPKDNEMEFRIVLDLASCERELRVVEMFGPLSLQVAEPICTQWRIR